MLPPLSPRHGEELIGTPIQRLPEFARPPHYEGAAKEKTRVVDCSALEVIKHGAVSLPSEISWKISSLAVVLELFASVSSVASVAAHGRSGTGGTTPG